MKTRLWLDPNRQAWNILVGIVSVLAILAVIVLLGGCAQVPKSYTWEVVDCHYQRGVEGLDTNQVKAKCELEGRVELTRPGLPF